MLGANGRGENWPGAWADMMLLTFVVTVEVKVAFDVTVVRSDSIVSCNICFSTEP